MGTLHQHYKDTSFAYLRRRVVDSVCGTDTPVFWRTSKPEIPRPRPPVWSLPLQSRVRLECTAPSLPYLPAQYCVGTVRGGNHFPVIVKQSFHFSRNRNIAWHLAI